MNIYIAMLEHSYLSYQENCSFIRHQVSFVSSLIKNRLKSVIGGSSNPGKDYDEDYF